MPSLSILKIKRSVPIVISDSYLLHIFCTNMYSAIVLWKQKKILLFLQCVVFPFQKNDPCIDRSEYDTNDVSYILVTKQTFLLYIVEVLRGKVQWVILAPLQVKSRSGTCNEIWILLPFRKAAEKTWSCFALDTEHQYWAVTVQYLWRANKISMTSNALPLHFSASQAS